MGAGQHNPKKVLIVLLGAIGDVTRALPLAVRIKKYWPEVELSWAVEPISRSIIDGHPAVDRIVLFDRPRGFPAYLGFLKKLRRERYDLVLDLQRHFKSGVTSFATGASQRIGFHPSNAKEFNWVFNTEHIPSVENFSPKINHYQLFGDQLGLEKSEPLEFQLVPSGEEVNNIETILSQLASEQGVILPAVDKRVGFIIGSTWASRLWTVERFAQVAQALWSKAQMTAFIIGTKAENQMAEQIVEVSPSGSVLNCCGQTSLRELVPLFSRVRFSLGSDSGPMHIAAAVGTPVISLWGSTSPARSRPEGNEQYVLQSALGCAPCYRRECPGLDNLCMSDIPSEAVLAQAERILARLA